ncbi:ribonuclease H-like domain-containing protein [Mycena alexandri]|uniref:3'-5' exonuclease n=1 Tax=Mycena alexandri TaxID=1745969 RepID=A0AAD6WZG5_9AGAR|nr:ribonuclease H-like domain-containing protein [Mycena alexandri]
MLVIPYAQTSTFYYITQLDLANNHLRAIVDSVIGFDTEFTLRAIPEHECIAMLLTPTSKNARRQYQIARMRSFPQGMPVDWVGAGICTVQIARGRNVFIINLKRIQAFPFELRRILESLRIRKVGTGFLADGKVIFEDLGCNVANFVDVGHMIRLAHPEKYALHSGKVSLETCVAHLLERYLDKGLGAATKWDETLDPTAIEYAGLDAQASLHVFFAASEHLRQKQNALGRIIPEDWYTYDFFEGSATRIVRNYLGERCPWSYTICPWYVAGAFSNYHM